MTLFSTILSTIALIYLLLLSETSALVTQPSLPTTISSRSSSCCCLHQTANGDGANGDGADKPPATSVELFESESWKIIKKDLDQVPIFCVANKEGKPVAYSITVKKTKEGSDTDKEDEEPITFQVPFFYTDVEDAKTELKKAKETTANKDVADEMDLIPFPLGSAFQMWSKDQAVIVPSGKAVQQAGAPPGTNPIGQSVPLFACMEIMQEMEVPDDTDTADSKEEGKTKMVPVLPLFMVLEECNAAVDQAVEMDGGKADQFEVVSLSLTRAVEQLASQASGFPGFQLIPPQASIEYINNYLSS
eukprot:CAMPEP_0113630164 /NCGR_PEP_ID=MMETSP0017_2-20120614/15668_1 /TAXON_ID=2856 /ORGANISM="Cylindrotheca closterium" /LENGTH=303 /DNA_ID=CAMNT_0000540609 /DNA_START=50 /DNA_END=961 /DNA_ORIENTATION=+ /assembly_acc=CAM_ASM_000147